MSGSGIGMAGGAAVGIGIAGEGVAVGGSGVAVGGAAVGNAGIAVGGTGLAVGGAAVGGADVAVGDAGIAVAVGCGSASVAGLRHAAIASMNRTERHAVAKKLMGTGKAFIAQSCLSFCVNKTCRTAAALYDIGIGRKIWLTRPARSESLGCRSSCLAC